MWILAAFSTARAAEAGWQAEQNFSSSGFQVGTAMTGPCCLFQFVVDVRFWPRGWSISVLAPPLMVFEGVLLDPGLVHTLPRFFLQIRV